MRTRQISAGSGAERSVPGVLRRLRASGQQVWIENFSRTLLRNGALSDWVRQGLCGMVADCGSYRQALAEPPEYQEEISRLMQSRHSFTERFEALAVPDLQAACDLFMPLYRDSAGDAGFVSMAVAPEWAYDTGGTVASARRLWHKIDRSNLLVGIPATPQGLQAIEACIAEGISVYATSLYAVSQLIATQNAYVKGLRRYAASGGDPGAVTSFAGICLAPVDFSVDGQLGEIGTSEALALRGKAASAIAHTAYRRYGDAFQGESYAELKAQGAAPQRLVWQTPTAARWEFLPLLYTTEVLLPETVAALPIEMLAAWVEQEAQDADDACRTSASMTNEIARKTAHSGQLLEALQQLGIDMEAVGEQLQEDDILEAGKDFIQLMAQLGDDIASHKSDQDARPPT